MTEPGQWVRLELDAGAAAFFGLPATVLVPAAARGRLRARPHAEWLPDLAAALAEVEANRAGTLPPEALGFLRRWPAVADIDRFLRMDNFAFARKRADDLCRRNPEDAFALTALAHIAVFEENDWERAAGLVERAAAGAPGFPPLELRRALTAAGAGRTDDALAILEGGPLSRSNHRSRVRFWRHEIRTTVPEALRDRVRAGLAWGAGLDRGGHAEPPPEPDTPNPGNPEVLYQKALRPDTADDERESLLERAVALDPDHIPAQAALCLRRRQTDRAPLALEHLETLLEAHPGDGLLLAARAQCLEQLDRREEAAVAFERVFEGTLAHLEGSVLMLAAEGLMRTAGPAVTRRLLQDAAEARPDDPLPSVMLARMDERHQNAHAAEKTLRDAGKRLGPHPNLQYALGDLLRRQGRHTEAEGIFRLLAKAHPGNAWGHVGLGDLEVQTQPAQAISHYEAALELQPGLSIPGLHYLRGVAALRTGEPDRARAEFERAVVAEPDQSRYWADLGAARFYDGDPGGAVAATERALGLEPDHPGYTHNLATFLEAQVRRAPWKLGTLWTVWRLRRRVARARDRGWRRDLFDPGRSDPGNDA